MKHEKNKRVEVYYEKLMKLTNNFHHKITYNLFIIVFRFRLRPYFHVAIVGMKRKTLQQHNEAVLVCEEGIDVEAINSLLVPYNGKIVLVRKPQIVLEKIGMYCINCPKTNHNVETHRTKRKEHLGHAISQVITQQIKV
jgi:hypothetical protein